MKIAAENNDQAQMKGGVMRNSSRLTTVLSALIAGLFPVLGPGNAAAAAPDASTMCGTGDTFTVALPGRQMPLDPSTENLPNRRLPNDSVTLPNGCDVYAVIVHGYGRNNELDELMYYKLAEWVTEHNGYVHWSWWNNFLGEYMSRPLHVIPGSTRGDADYPFPGDVVKNAWDFLRGGSGKAVPDEDEQFQDDAEAVLAKIRENNPNAIVIVAGHSMGGNAVARLGSNTAVTIDLLAPIDPVGNRNLPVGQGGATGYTLGTASAVPGASRYKKGNETFNWTRWRATHNFRGWIDRDCIRNGLGLCEDFDSRLFYVSYRCRTVDSTPKNEKTGNGLLADRACPDSYSYSGVRFGANIRRLYHRWQRETYFPYDWDASYLFSFPSATLKQTAPFDVSYHNYQRAVAEYAESELPLSAPVATASKTCAFDTKNDPSGARSFDGELLKCQQWDGHGEIIGMRATKGSLISAVPPTPTKKNLNPLALTADWNNANADENWERIDPWRPALSVADASCSSAACRRRRALVELSEPGAWRFRPKDPDLDLVVNDLVLIAENLWELRDSSGPSGPDTTPPTSTAADEPAANPFGWHNTDVVVTISAADEDGGSGVKEITYGLSGASSGNAAVLGAEFELQITAEGTTTVEFFATDNAGNAGEPQTLTVNIDKTPPRIEANVAPPPDANGWNNTNVTVTFTAEDDLSGIDTVSDPVTLTNEGPDQEAVGVATDRAGNTASGGAIVNIDKPLPCDVDNDGDADKADLDLLYPLARGRTPVDSSNAGGDADGNGVINVADYVRCRFRIAGKPLRP